MKTYLRKNFIPLLLIAVFVTTYFLTRPSRPVLPAVPTVTVSLEQFGGRANDVISDDLAMEKAVRYIDSCGGGVIKFDTGTYVMSRPIDMRNHVFHVSNFEFYGIDDSLMNVVANDSSYFFMKPTKFNPPANGKSKADAVFIL